MLREVVLSVVDKEKETVKNGAVGKDTWLEYTEDKERSYVEL